MDAELEKIMKVLADSYAIKILTASYNTEKSAIQLSQELNVPIAACYRRIHTLQSLGLLNEFERLNNKGKKIKYYSSVIKRVSIKIERNQITIELMDREGKKKVYRGIIVRKGYGE